MNNEDGLSQNSVISVAQDSTGYLWIATRSGLNRYNGNEFKYYNKQFDAFDKGKGKQMGRLYVDRQDVLWIISQGGVLEKYDKEDDGFNEIKTFGSVASIFQDSYSNIYISNYSSEVFIINNKTKDTSLVFKSEDTFFVNYFLQKQDSIYMSSYNQVTSLSIKDAKFQVIQNSNSSKNGVITSDRDQTLWLGTLGDGLYYKTKSDKAFLPASNINKQLPSDLYILSLHVDRYDRLWVCTLKTGIFLLDLKENTLEKLKFQKGNLYAIVDNEIICLYEDNNGVIWLGTNTSGLAYYDEYLSKFNVLTSSQVPEDVNVDVVLSVSTDDANNMFLGTLYGLTVFNTQSKDFKTLTKNNSPLLTNTINGLLFDENELWIATSTEIGNKGGINILKKNPFNGDYQDYFKVKLDVGWINQIFKDSHGDVWLATSNGLIAFDKEKISDETYHEGLIKGIPSVEISCILEDENETLWMSTYDDKGIYTLDLKSRKTKQETTHFKNIKTLYRDKQNDSLLWVGTNGYGLYSYNIETKQVKSFSIPEGLPDATVYSILSDSDNNLWLSTNNGISKFNYQEKGNFYIENFGLNDGLQSLEFNSNAYYKDSNGVLYFGGLSGLNWFNPESIVKNPNVPKTNISGITVLDKAIDYSVENEFSNNQNTISFSFESLNFSKPEGNSFKYRLVNHDNDWVESGNINVARYVNLPPNDYTFEVISSNYDGVWNTTPATFSFTILKPWYANNLAKMVYFILTLLIIYGIYRYFKGRWFMRMQLELESRETARWKKLDEFKTKLYNNISHEFRTPLTLISGPVENQLVKPNLSETDRNELNLIKRNSKRLLNLVNQLLDLSKLETGNLKLLVSKGNLTVLLKQLATAFEFKAKEKGITFSYDIADIEEAWFDRDVIEKIVSNLLNNAVKYAPKNGYVSFLATLNEGYLTLTVINNGNHLKDEELPKLFQRYYQNDKHSEGVGIGLSLVKELTVLSHGNVVAHTMNTDDIQFVVSLPIERSYFNAMEIVDSNFDRELSEDTPDLEDETILEFHKDNEKPLLLIVEDDEDIRTFVKSIFKADYKIVEAQDGEIGIKKALQHIPDVIVSDVMMPKVDGIELCNTLKEDFKTSHIPIILLTAKFGDHNEIEGLKTGADAYITKPFNSEKLKIRVEKLISTRKKLQAYYGKNNALDFHNLKVSKTDEQFFNNLQEAIKEDLIQTDFTSERLSKLMYMSRMQLHRKLKALLGLSTSEFIRNERLKLAIALLEKSDSTISEIAYQTGFNTPQYFMKCFKEVYHCTPTEHLQNIEK